MSFLRRISYFFDFMASVLSLNFYLLKGMWKLTVLKRPAATIFGGSRIKLEDPVAQQAIILSKKLAASGYSIITGGGPGIMAAANYGAMSYLEECKKTKGKECPTFVSGGIGVIHLNQERVNQYVQTSVVMDHFFSRKWLLVRYSSAFVFFAGGFGTLDEFFEVITLVQTNKMPRYPVVLIGSNYWAPMLDWIQERALAHGLIEQGDQKLFLVTDDIDLAVKFILSHAVK